MIPKIIHYCWFGGKDKPKDVIKCIESWKRHMPDYEIVEWNESNFDINFSQFTKEAYSLRKYAFVSDVARLYALVKCGGIYFDTDIEVLKSFDDILDKEYLLGYEQEGKIGTGVIGSAKGLYFIEGFLNTYKYKKFILGDNKYNTIPNPKLLSDYIEQNKLKLEVYDTDYFCAKSFLTGKITKTENTYCIHHFSGSWLTKWQKFKLWIHHILRM